MIGRKPIEIRSPKRELLIHKEDNNMSDTFEFRLTDSNEAWELWKAMGEPCDDCGNLTCRINQRDAMVAFCGRLHAMVSGSYGESFSAEQLYEALAADTEQLTTMRRRHHVLSFAHGLWEYGHFITQEAVEEALERFPLTEEEAMIEAAMAAALPAIIQRLLGGAEPGSGFVVIGDDGQPSSIIMVGGGAGMS